MSNQITAYFKGRTGVAEPVYQNDYGMVLNFDGIYLPSNFDCHFSVLGSDTAIPGVGADNRVAIPNTVLSHEGNVTVHIPLHTGSDDSEVEYVVYFKVIGRARPEDDGTPVQMTAIEKALALLSQPITNIEEIVNEALSFTGETFDEMRSDLQGDYDTFAAGVSDDISDMQEDIAGFKTEIRGNISDVESNFTVLQGQFDTAVAGVTTDTEVTDIRVGADGVTDTTAGASVRRQFTNLKEEINDVVDFEKYVFQFLDQSKRNTGKLWVSSGGTVHMDGGFDVNTYTAYEPIKLKAGKYHFNGFIYGGQSFMDVDGVISNLSALGNSLSPANNYEFTLSDDCTLYLSASFQRVPNGLALYNHLDGFYSDSVQYGILASKDREAIMDHEDRIDNLESAIIVPYENYDQFYIKNNALVCENSKNHTGIVAKYAIVDLGATISKVMARLKIKGGSLALIVSNHKEPKLIETITKGSVHITLDYYKVEVGIYIDNGNQHDLCTICTTGMTVDGVSEYQFGYEFMGNNKVRFYLPQNLRAEDPIIIRDEDCSVTRVSDNVVDVTYVGIDSYNGQYLVIEEYQGNAVPNTELLIPYVTGVYAKASNVPSFKDNFMRENGAINVSPTGHIYTLFCSADNSDTIYDSNPAL